MAALVAAVVLTIGLSGCQLQRGGFSDLRAGYVFYDARIDHQPVQQWSSGTDRAIVRTDPQHAGELVYVQVFCSGVLVRTVYNYATYQSPTVAQATLLNAGAPTAACMFREHVPSGWPAPSVSLGASRDSSGTITGIGIVFSNY